MFLRVPAAKIAICEMDYNLQYVGVVDDGAVQLGIQDEAAAN